MNQILSQDEVDALLKGLDTGEIETKGESGEPEVEVQSYDWSTQGKHLKGSLPMLSVVGERFSQRLTQALSGALGKVVNVETGPLAMTKFEEFQRSLPVPTSLHLFKMEPLRGMGMLVIENRLVFNLVEAFFGGPGTGSTKVEGRDFTPIERKIINKVVKIILDMMSEAWRQVYPVRVEFIRSETNPVAVTALGPAESLVMLKFEVELNKPAGNIIVCLPYSSLQPIREILSGGYQEEGADADKGWTDALKEQLKESEMEVAVDLGIVRLAVRDFLGMKEGDILVLENGSQGLLVGKVEGVPKFQGSMGRVKNRKAFRIVGQFSPPADQG